ncbi:MAG: LuxR C-terminal-related transcriptional regulator [Myxococcota bacterium]
MRRIGLRETLHGTRDGQLAVDASLAERYGLSERESACAALVKRGCSAHEIADRLEISPSTAEKHLVALRRKLGVSSTLEAAVALLGEESESTARIPDAFGVVLPVSSSDKAASDTAIDSSSTDLVARLRTAATLDEMLELVRADLEDDGVVALFWYFLPLSAASFRKGDVLQRHSAPASLIDALQADSGATQARTAARLFAEPDRPVVVRLDRDDDAVSSLVAAACRRASVGVGITLGSPFGAGYVVLSAFYRTEPEATEDLAAAQSDRERRLRERLLLMQNVAYSLGALARSAGLSLRERDALALIAAGHGTRSAAEAAGTTERALGQLLQSARRKLGADTTAEAVAKAMALNALVFL